MAEQGRFFLIGVLKRDRRFKFDGGGGGKAYLHQRIYRLAVLTALGTGLSLSIDLVFRPPYCRFIE